MGYERSSGHDRAEAKDWISPNVRPGVKVSRCQQRVRQSMPALPKQDILTVDLGA